MCEVWAHAECFGVTDLEADFFCPDCADVRVQGMRRGWKDCLFLQRQLVKCLMDRSYGKGVADEFQTWMANQNIVAPDLGRSIGDRFFGTFFASAQLVKIKSHVARVGLFKTSLFSTFHRLYISKVFLNVSKFYFFCERILIFFYQPFIW